MQLYLDTLAFTATIVAPIFLILFVGQLIYRLRLIDDAFVNSAARLVFVLALPVLVFTSIASTDFQAVFNPHLLLFVVIATLISVALISLAAFRWVAPAEHTGVFIQGAFRGNYGIIGLAVSASLFGQTGLAQAAMLLALIIPLYNILATIALTLPLRRQRALSATAVVMQIIRNPLIIAVVLALPFSYWQLPLPSLLARSAAYLADLTLPLALLSIGASLNIASLRDASAHTFWASAIKLLIQPAVLTGAAWWLGYPYDHLALLFILFGCPTAAASFVMAKAMGGNGALAANIVLATTLGSVLTLSAGIYLMRLLQWV